MPWGISLGGGMIVRVVDVLTDLITTIGGINSPPITRDPGGIQTRDLQNRNLTLYSAKLPDLVNSKTRLVWYMATRLLLKLTIVHRCLLFYSKALEVWGKGVVTVSAVIYYF